MGKLLLASVAVAALTCQAAAQDGKINWAGSYIGLEAGVGFSRPGFSGDGRASGSDFDDTGFVGGIFIGHDWQHERWIYGISGNFDLLDFENQVARYDTFFGGKIDASDQYGYDLNWVASLRGRLGYLVNDNFLIYGTGGVAVTQVRATSESPGIFIPIIPIFIPGGSDSVSATRVGGVFGAGIEYALNNKWTFRTEYVHYLFGSVHVGGGSSGARPVSFDPSFGTLTVGVAYHF
jgi:opacity protein-like surface antigen